MDVLKKLFIVSLLLYPLGQVARVRVFTSASFTIFDIGVLLVVITFFIIKIQRHEGINIGRIEKASAFFIACCLLSLLTQIQVLQPNELFISSLYLFRWILYFCIYLVVKDISQTKRQLYVDTSLLSGGVVLIIGILQYFFYNNLGNLRYLEWDDHLYRLFGTFLDPNFTGVFLVLYFLLVLSQIKNSSTKRRTILFTLTILSLFAIIVTYSRTALIMLIASMAMLIFMSPYKKILIILSGLAFLFVLLFSDVKTEGMNPFRTASSRERLISMNNAIQIIQKNPVFGVGFNAYRYAQHRYGIRESAQWQVSNADAGTDNSLLFVFATTGILGLTGYLGLWVTILLEAFQKGRKEYFSKIVFISCVALLVSSFFLNTLFYPFLLFWIWMMIGFTAKDEKSMK